MRPPPQKAGLNSNKRPTVLYLVCAAAFFSLLVFGIQSSLFARTKPESESESESESPSGATASSASLISFHYSYLLLPALFINFYRMYPVKLDVNTQQDIRTLSEFQSTVQQCVVSCKFPPCFLWICNCVN